MALPQYIYPLRGYLLQLLPVGCSAPAPAPASRAALAHYNATHATYSCARPGLVFAATRAPEMTLVCVGNHYHTQLGQCVRWRKIISTFGTVKYSKIFPGSSVVMCRDGWDCVGLCGR